MKRMWIIVALAALMAPVMLAAQPGGGRGCGMAGACGMHGGKARMERGMHMSMRSRGPAGGFLAMAEELQLTEEQKNKLEAMRTEFQTQNVDRRAALEKAEIRLRSLQRDEAPAVDVNRAIDDVTRLRAEMQKAQYAHHQAMKGVLTADQVKKLDQLRTERRTVTRERVRKIILDDGEDGDI